ncbi:ABC transporter ATP-binding protein [Roseovarius amoyensis]|uniref:ABC transporter ATP-binding protein n=1 Tax=Roseovarius amoyensis TaxID=2211448 RepID=UPI000DBE46BF|nr:ABC transporter ATP-binding protein [Roseovarius amoyensis]
MPDDRAVVRIEGLQVAYEAAEGPVRAVEDLSLTLAPGEVLCLVGESGSGKSAAALAMMRLVEFDGGRITGGKVLFERAGGMTDLTRLDQKAMRTIRGREIGMIFQEPATALNPVITIGRQLAEGLRRHEGLSRRAARARAADLLHQVRLPDPERRLRQYPHELSGGQRQRVMIAMALACRPRLLIADEPTTALDVTVQAEILTLIDRLRRETGTAVIFITHDMAVVAQIADRVVVMHEGRKVEEGPVARIFSAPAHPHTRALLAAVSRTGPVPARPGAGGEAPLLSVRGLVTRYAMRGGMAGRREKGRLHAVQDLSFDIGHGRTLALVGETGSGKTTVGRSILRLVEPDAGQVLLAGRDLTRLDARALRQARRGVQMIFQDPSDSLDPRMSCGKQVIEPLLNFGIGNPAERADMAAQLFDRVGLPRALMTRYPHALSGGQRQRVAIARALTLSPKLLVADEAVSALDAGVRAQVLDLLAQLQADLGISCLFISHDIGAVARISHDVAVMYRGRIVEMGPCAAVLENPRHAYTRALMRAVPVPDPARRGGFEALQSSAVATPIHPRGHESGPSVYREAGPGHRVLVSDCGYVEQEVGNAREEPLCRDA